MKIYTRAGDYGETTIFGGVKVRKNTLLVAAYGTLDELSSYIGLCRSFCEGDYEIGAFLKEVQHDLYLIGSHLAGADEKIDETRIEYLENRIDHYDAQLDELHTFILPGGTRLAALLHVARAVCRRAERKLSPIYENEGNFLTELKYLNRLSDTLFVLARYVNMKGNAKDELAY